MADVIGSLSVDISANLASLYAGMREATEVVARSTKQMGDQFEQMNSSVSSVFSTLSKLATFAVAGFSLKGLADMVTDAVAAEAHLHDLAQVVGSTASSLSALIPAARLSGTSIEEVGQASAKFAKNLATAGDASSNVVKALQAFGFSAKDVGRLLADPVQGMQELAKAMNNFADGGNKTAAAMVLLGRGGAQLLPFFKELAQQEELAALFTDEQAAAADRLGDQWDLLKLRGEELRRVIGNAIVPVLNDMLAALLESKDKTEGFGGAIRELAQNKTFELAMLEVWRALVQVKEGFQDLVNFMAIVIAAIKAVIDVMVIIGQVFAGFYQQVAGGMAIAAGRFSEGVELIRQGSSRIVNALKGDYATEFKNSLKALQIAEQEFWDAGNKAQSAALTARIAELKRWQAQYEAADEATKKRLVTGLSPTAFGPSAPPLAEPPKLDLGPVSEFQKALQNLEKQARTAGAELQALYSGTTLTAAQKFIEELKAEGTVWNTLSAAQKKTLEQRAANISLLQTELTQEQARRVGIIATAAALERYAAAQAAALRTIAGASADAQIAAIGRQQDEIKRQYDRGLINFKSFYDQQTALQRQAIDIQIQNEQFGIDQQRALLETLQQSAASLGQQLSAIDANTNLKAYNEVLLKLYDVMGKIVTVSGTLNAAETKLGDTEARRAEIGKDQVEQLHEVNKAYEQSVQSINEQVDAQNLQAQTIGLTASQTHAYISALLAERAAYEELHGASTERIADLRAQSEAQARLAASFARTEGIQQSIDAIKQFDQEAHDVFASVFEQGDNTFKRIGQSIKRYLIDLLYQLALKPFIINIAAQITGVNSNALATALGGGNPLGIFGNLFGGGGGSNPLSFLTNFLSGGTQAAAPIIDLSSVAVGSSGFAAAPLTEAFGAATSGASAFATSLVTAGEVVTPTLAAIGSEAAVGATAAAGLGTALSTAIPVIGTVVAGLALFGGGLFNKEPSKVKGQFQISGGTEGFEDNVFTKSSFGNLGFVDAATQQFSGEAAQAFNKIIAGALDAFETRFSPEQSARLAKILQGTTFKSAEGEYTTEDFLKTYGGDVLQQVVVAAFDVLDPALGAVAAAFEGTADEVSAFGNTLLSIYDATQAFRTNFGDALKGALESADSSAVAEAFVDQFVANVDTALADATQETADKVLAFVNIVNSVANAFPNLAVKLASLDPSKMIAFVDAMGGAQKAIAGFAFINQNFTTSAERAQQAQQTLANAWDKANLTAEDLAKAGLSSVTTHDQFMQLLDSLDLNTEHGQQLAAILINEVGPAFINVAGSAEQAAAALNNAAQRGYDYFTQHFLTPQEQLSQRQTVDSTVIFNATRDTTLLGKAFKDLNLDIPLTIDSVRNVRAVLVETYGPASDIVKQFDALIPTIGDLIDSAGGFDDVVKQVTETLTVSVGSIIQVAQSAADKLIASYENLASQSTGDFGARIALELDLINNAIENTNRADFTSGTEYTAYISKLQSTANALSAELARFTVLSAQYDAARAEQLVGLEQWYSDQLKALGLSGIQTQIAALEERREALIRLGVALSSSRITYIDDQIAALEASGGPVLDALQTIFQQKWDAIVNGASAAAESLDDFIKRIQGIANAIGGNAAQQAGIEQQFVAAKLADLSSQYAKLDPTSVTAKAIQQQIATLTTYNENLAQQIANYSIYVAQFGAEQANQLVELENWYAEQKKIISEALAGHQPELTAALDILATVFNDKWQAIINGGKNAAQSLDDFIQSIQQIAAAPKGNAGQQAGIELALSSARLSDLEAQLAAALPGSALAISLQTDITKLRTYNTFLAKEIANFALYSEQYGAAAASQLVQLERQFEEWKTSVAGNAEALAIVTDIFNEQFQAIIDSVSDGVDELSRLKADIANYLKGLVISDLSPLTPTQRFAEAQLAYLDTLERAQGGDLSALGEITKFADAYLQQARDFYSSSQQYTDIFNAVTAQLGALADVSPTGLPVEATVVQDVALAAALPSGRLASQSDVEANTAATTNLTNLIQDLLLLQIQTQSTQDDETQAILERLLTAYQRTAVTVK